MKTWWLLGFSLIAASAAAQVLRPINPAQLADVNSQVIQPERLSTETVALPVQAPVLATGVSDQRAPARVIRSGTVPLPVKRLPSARLRTRPLRLVPTQNFVPRSSGVGDQRVVAGLVPLLAAPLTNRTLNATTPDGQQELRDQLNRRQ